MTVGWGLAPACHPELASGSQEANSLAFGRLLVQARNDCLDAATMASNFVSNDFHYLVKFVHMGLAPPM